MTPDISFAQHELVLQRERFFVGCLVPRVQLEEADGLRYLRDATEHYTYRLVLDILGRKARHTVTYPADWWQHFKQRWFPRWALNRWPVRLAEVTVHASELFPELKPPFRGRYQVIRGFDRIEHFRPGNG